MSEQPRINPTIDHERCSGCGQCVDACPTGALQLVDGLAGLAEPELCAYCADCEDLCPEGAIGLPYVVEFEEDQESSGE